MYMQGYRCNVTGSTSTIPLATPKPPVWCEDAPNKCIKGAKQLMSWHQKSGNNMNVTGFDLSGNPKSPGYTMKCGFMNGEFVNLLFITFFFSLSFFLSNGWKYRCPERYFRWDCKLEQPEETLGRRWRRWRRYEHRQDAPRRCIILSQT